MAPVIEKEQVQSWRLATLIDAGYAMPHAEKLADSDVDLHKAVEIRQNVERNPRYQGLQGEQRSKLAFQVFY